jgi:predicted nucleic acid-binding protein
MARTLMLDTTYLLPLFGIDVPLQRYPEVFPKLIAKHEVWYSPLSLVEAKWIILNLVRRDVGKREAYLEKYRRGLGVLFAHSRLRQTELTTPQTEYEADELLRKVSDYFDRMIYATAKQLGLTLISEDRVLKRLDGVISWDELIQRFT